ncbi:hypothetical protein FACS1894137_17970 [Spirochaetia bacterium]|nr:hypothetical protein FACS1894137_17970 [Spirochaetia bacterium]
MLALKKREQAETVPQITALDKQIDEEVYGLTEKEIMMVRFP